MTKPIERKYDINKKKKNKKKSSGFITQVPHDPVMLSKDELFNNTKKLLLSEKSLNPEILELAKQIEDLNKHQKIGTVIIKNNRQIHIKTDLNRVKLLKYLAKEFNGTYVDTPNSISSVGYVELPSNIRLVAKPNKAHSAGVLNEKILGDIINKYCASGPINIKFVGKNKVFKCVGVMNCKLTGTSTKGRRKADLVLQGNIEYPISLKKDNAEVWESADSYMGRRARAILDELIKDGRIELKLTDKGVYYLKPNVAFLPSIDEKNDVVFGSDILPNGAVIVKSFDSESIVSIDDNGWLEIPVTKVITNLNDLDDHDDVVFLVRNDSSRNPKGLGYKGLRVLAVYRSRLNKNILIYNNVK